MKKDEILKKEKIYKDKYLNGDFNFINFHDRAELHSMFNYLIFEIMNIKEDLIQIEVENGLRQERIKEMIIKLKNKEN